MLLALLSFLPVCVALAAIGFFVAAPVITLAILCAALMFLKSHLSGRESAKSNNGALYKFRHACVTLIDVWIVFLAPFHGIAVMGIVAMFSLTWGLAVGAIMIAFPKFSTFFYYNGNNGVKRWEAALNTVSKLVGPVFRYFPVTTHVTGNTYASPRPRLFCYHPHGMYAFGLFSLIFPMEGVKASIDGYRPILVGVASSLLSIPIFGTLCAWFGFIPASRRYLESLLPQLRGAYDLALIPGGIAEMLEYEEQEASSPKGVVETVYLKRRKGFIRLALAHGFDIVPVYGFGENRTFKRYGFGKKVREIISRTFKVILQPYLGRYFTLIPFNVPLNIVIGPRIVLKPPINDRQPLPEEVDAAHKNYMVALHTLLKSTKESFRTIEMRL